MNNTLKIFFVDNPDLAEQVCAFCDTRRSSGRRRSGSMPSVTRRRGGWSRGFIWNLRRRGRATWPSWPTPIISLGWACVKR